MTLSASPVEKWRGHPNLRHRPPSPALGRGRLQRQICRCFLAHGPLVTSSQVYDWAYVNRRKLTQRHRHSVWRILRDIAKPIRRMPPYGAWLWRLKR
jgi:hypothetical protein